MVTDGSKTSVIGPRDRESFFDAQRRNRRATWRLSAVSVLAAVVMGIPLALIVTPLIYAVTLIGASVVNYFLPLPPEFWRQADKFANFAMTAGNWLFNRQPADPQGLALGAAVLLVPGAVLSVALWLGVNALFRRAGVGGALLALKAREPNPADLNELRLSDVVQEMAIAAGVLTNTPENLADWLRNPGAIKPGNYMQTFIHDFFCQPFVGNIVLLYQLGVELFPGGIFFFVFELAVDFVLNGRKGQGTGGDQGIQVDQMPPKGGRDRATPKSVGHAFQRPGEALAEFPVDLIGPLHVHA